MMRRSIQVALALLLVACNQQNSQDASKIADLEAKVDKLQTELKATKEDVTSENFSISVLRSQLADINNSPAYVDTEQELYGVANTQYGTFLVFAESATPYLDGFRVTLKIVNLTSIQFDGVKLKVDWRLFDDAPKDASGGFQEPLSKEFDISGSFPPGASHSVSVVLSPAKPAEVKHIQVLPTFNELRYFKR